MIGLGGLVGASVKLYDLILISLDDVQQLAYLTVQSRHLAFEAAASLLP